MVKIVGESIIADIYEINMELQNICQSIFNKAALSIFKTFN